MTLEIHYQNIFIFICSFLLFIGRVDNASVAMAIPVVCLLTSWEQKAKLALRIYFEENLVKYGDNDDDDDDGVVITISPGSNCWRKTKDEQEFLVILMLMMVITISPGSSLSNHV